MLINLGVKRVYRINSGPKRGPKLIWAEYIPCREYDGNGIIWELKKWSHDSHHWVGYIHGNLSSYMIFYFSAEEAWQKYLTNLERTIVSEKRDLEKHECHLKIGLKRSKEV